jgi:uncharacterized protein YbbC (DUF1343 family)
LSNSTVRPGIDVLIGSPDVRGKVGLLSNVACLTHNGRTTFDALRDAGIEVSVIFAPEHGYFGLGSAGEKMNDGQLGGVPIASLYGKSYEPPAELLSPLSAVLVDLQDTGNRWYTYLATVAHLLKACAQTRILVIVLDRPNPQGGEVVEGPIAEPAYFSLVAPGAFPARYGLTIGEGAQLLNRDMGADLQVVAMEGWQRWMQYADTGLIWSAPSPNMPHVETTFAYTGTCLIEGTILSEGRGTALPFEQIGAPFVDGIRLCDEMNSLTLAGVVFSPAWFRPSVQKFAGEHCQGVRVHITDTRAVRGFSLGLHLIATLRRLYPADFAWEPNGFFDKLAATTQIRTALEQGQPVPEIITWCDEESQLFKEATRSLWIYP